MLNTKTYVALTSVVLVVTLMVLEKVYERVHDHQDLLRIESAIDRLTQSAFYTENALKRMERDDYFTPVPLRRILDNTRRLKQYDTVERIHTYFNDLSMDSVYEQIIEFTLLNETEWLTITQELEKVTSGYSALKGCELYMRGGHVDAKCNMEWRSWER